MLIHSVLREKFLRLLDEDKDFHNTFFHIMTEGTPYIIGGFIRDVFENKQSRDIDIVVDINKDRLKEIIESESCSYQLNRFGGAKVQFKNIVVDFWSFESNWAFINKLVKLNDKEKLNSLAKGCFFNYDALVVNAVNFSYNTKFFENFLEKRELDILQKRALYKNLNPSLEANILRAIYIQKKYNATMSNNLKEYVYKKTASLNDVFGDAVERLLEVKKLFPKYYSVEKTDITNLMASIKNDIPKTLFDQ